MLETGKKVENISSCWSDEVKLLAELIALQLFKGAYKYSSLGVHQDQHTCRRSNSSPTLYFGYAIDSWKLIVAAQGCQSQFLNRLKAQYIRWMPALKSIELQSAAAVLNFEVSC